MEIKTGQYDQWRISSVFTLRYNYFCNTFHIVFTLQYCIYRKLKFWSTFMQQITVQSIHAT